MVQGKSRNRRLGQTHLLILESLLEKQGATATPPGDIETGGSHSGELFSTVWTLVLAGTIVKSFG